MRAVKQITYGPIEGFTESNMFYFQLPCKSLLILDSGASIDVLYDTKLFDLEYAGADIAVKSVTDAAISKQLYPIDTGLYIHRRRLILQDPCLVENENFSDASIKGLIGIPTLTKYKLVLDFSRGIVYT
jgi:hypothetical protein